ncbi:Protein SABRE [Coemansia sp. RSA 1365]|nr:Protein SABRE [Coemansia sp. RSA 1365]
MQLPLVSIILVGLLSVLLPIPNRYAEKGSFAHETLQTLHVPQAAAQLLLHPMIITALVHYLLLRLGQVVLSYPVRYFLLGFGLRVNSFSGSSFSGLVVKVHMRGRTEVALRIDEIGIDIRTMRRLRMRIRMRWSQIKNRYRSIGQGSHQQTSVPTAETPSTPPAPEAESARTSTDSYASTQGPTPGVHPDQSAMREGASNSRSSFLSKRLQIYARGVQIHLFTESRANTQADNGSDRMWLFDDKPNSNTNFAAQPATSDEQPRDNNNATPGEPVLDRKAQELAAKLAKKLSTILRTYTYFASIFAQWVDINVTDIRLMVAHNCEMARAGHGITLQINSSAMWAESARESRSAGISGGRWIQMDIANSLRGILDWLLRALNFQRTEDSSEGQQESTTDTFAASERLHRLARVQKRDRSRKYLSTLALEFTGVRLLAGIDGTAQQHMNSRWELVKTLVMQDMLAGKGAGDSDKPHQRGPAVNFQRCTVRNEVITTFWGLPKKVDQSVELGQVHVRAGVVESLLDEVSILRMAPGTRSDNTRSRGMRTLNSHLASLLRQYSSSSSSSSSSSPTEKSEPEVPNSNQADTDASASATTAESEAREQVNRLLFLLHEVLSNLRLEHVGFALRVPELVFDLPLTSANKQTPFVAAPAMLRWRQRGMEIEGGYMWNSLSSALGSTTNAGRLSTESIRRSCSTDSAQRAWDVSGGGEDDEEDAYARGSEGGTSGRRQAKDSTAFLRAALGTVHATALQTPSMTPDARAEEQQADAPGFRLRLCTVYGEMSAFLSEDLSQRPCPQPIVYLDVGRPELVLNLQTQLAIDDARRWAARLRMRLRAVRTILRGDRQQPISPAAPDGQTNGAGGHYMHALFDLVFSEVQVHVAVERALYAVQPHVSTEKGLDGGRIALRVHHFESHLQWTLGSGNESATIKFRATSSPVVARWEARSADVPQRTLLHVKRGFHASGSASFRFHASGSASFSCSNEAATGSRSPRRRVNINASVEAGEVTCMLREYDFERWLSMQPLWLATRFMHNESEVTRSTTSTTYSTPPKQPTEKWQQKLAATVLVSFDSLRATILASDNEEDVRSGIEHGMQVCLVRGSVGVRANGGSAESPHSFGKRIGAGPLTFNVECQHATMFLLSAVPPALAQPESHSTSADFAAEDLCGWQADMVQQHIKLVHPRLNIDRQRLEPHRARLELELKAVSMSGTAGVSSVYRWAVVMHHIKYWRRRRRLARYMATGIAEPDVPDDVVVTIDSELVDVRGDLVRPVFFDVDGTGGVQMEENAVPGSLAPQLKLRIPQAQFRFEKTRQSTDGDVAITLAGPQMTLYGKSTPRGQTAHMAPQPLMSLSDSRVQLRFPSKAKRAELARAQGLRSNSTYGSIDIAFLRGALALGHRYNMAETIDGYSLLQKACKRIARKSAATCFPPKVAVAEGQRFSVRQLVAALGNARTFKPPALRSSAVVRPGAPPALQEPDDIPTVNFHGPQFTVMVHDDPFETALSRIYQVGLHEQRERLSRLEAFDARAQEMRNASTRATRRGSLSADSRMAAPRETPTPLRRKHTAGLHAYHRRGRRAAKEPRSMSSASLQATGGGFQTPRSANRQSFEPPVTAPIAGRSMRDGAESATASQSSASLAVDGAEKLVMSELPGGDVEAEIASAYQRLLRVEAREWVQAIRRHMVAPVEQAGSSCGDEDALEEIFEGTTAGLGAQRCGAAGARPPYMFSAAAWTHPLVPLAQLVLAPLWLTLDTPPALLEFAQVERYLRHLDAATPRQPEWATLVPLRLRVKSGDVHMQLRDFPFPLLSVPAPNRCADTSRTDEPSCYDEAPAALEVSGSLVLAERAAHERSLRSVFIPVGPCARDSPTGLRSAGWLVSKSLQFPRIFAALSMLLFSAPAASDADAPAPIMSAWGASIQPVVSTLMQRLESATSKSADVSPGLPWWDKLRSRLHFKCRSAVVEAGAAQDEPGCERGQMFFLLLDGRNPYQVTHKPGSYLFTMRGGVRVCMNEGMPGTELWDRASGRGIYSAPTEDAAPPSAALGEFLQLRCSEFLMGIPIVVDGPTSGVSDAGHGSLGNTYGSPDSAAGCVGETQSGTFGCGQAGSSFAFATHSVDTLYHKVLLHLSSGVRMGIGLSSFIPPDRTGRRRTHWDVHPIAPESSFAMAVLGISDAYAGYRSTRLHTSISLLSPFVSPADSDTVSAFASLYLAPTKPPFDDAGMQLPRLREPDARVRSKAPGCWTAHDVEALLSPLHTLFPDMQDTAQDLFFTPFSRSATPNNNSSTVPQCRISATAAVVEGVRRHLPLYVARMLLPVRKGSLYPFTETSDNKIGRCLRSMRLVLDLRNVELAYSQRDQDIKELESRELDELRLSAGAAAGAKAEGTVRELKARVVSLSFSLLLEQAQVKLHVDSHAAATSVTDSPRSASESSPRARRSTPRPHRRPGHRPQAESETTALRWGIGDASLEIDYLDVRLVQAAFVLPLFAAAADHPASAAGARQTVNGLQFEQSALQDVSAADRSWISGATMRDLHALDVRQALFSAPSVVCVLWSPRMVYFTQRPSLALFDGRLDEILDGSESTMGFVSAAAELSANQRSSPAVQPPPLRAGPTRSLGCGQLPTVDPQLQRSNSAQRSRAVTDLRSPNTRPRTSESGDASSVYTVATHRRNSLMMDVSDEDICNDTYPGISESGGISAELPGVEMRTPASARSYRSSFHLLGLARTRQRRRTMAGAQTPDREMSPHGSEHNLPELLQRQPSLPMELPQNQTARMAPTGPDPAVIMRDSRSTQAMLLHKRKQMLGAAIQNEQAALATLSSQFEQASSDDGERFRSEMLQRAEHIYELGARRKLINGCMRVLGVDPQNPFRRHASVGSPENKDAAAGAGEVEDDGDGLKYDQDTQEVEKVLAALYRHRCLIYSGYLIWTTQVRDCLMRFLYIQDCLMAIEYYLSESATNVVRSAVATRSKESAAAAAAEAFSTDTPPPSGDRRRSSTIHQFTPMASRPDVPPTTGRQRSGSQHSNKSGSSQRSRHIPALLRRLRSSEKIGGKSKSNSQGSKDAKKKRGARPRATSKHSHKENPRKHTSKFDQGLARVWEDFIRYRPYYSILVEFLNSQVSLRVDDDSSTTSAIAVAERVQLHRILLCNESDFPEIDGGVTATASTAAGAMTGAAAAHRQEEPPSDESVVKARSLAELENVQVFTANREDFAHQAAYFADCTYGSKTSTKEEEEEAPGGQPSALWPAWIPIELLLGQEGKQQQPRGIFEGFDDAEKKNQEEDGAEHSDSDQSAVSSSSHSKQRGGKRRAWWLDDLSKYKRLMSRNSGLVVYDKANPLRIQSDTAEILRTRGVNDETENMSDFGGTDGDVSEDDFVFESGEAEDDPIDNEEASGNSQGLAHRANHFSVFLPELSLACTAEQYTELYEIVTDLLVFIDPEKATYMDHLNTIQLGMDMSDLRGLLSIIRATQNALRERMPMIYEWYAAQRRGAMPRVHAAALLTLARHRSALELQLRTAMDLFGAAQRQMRQQQRHRRQEVPETDVGTHSSASSQSSGLRGTESHSTIARTIHLFMAKATWHMLENDEQPLCDVALRWASLKAVTTSDQATHVLSEVHLLYIVNRLPRPMFTDLIGPYLHPRHAAPDFCVERMIRVQWSELAPVGGISIVERFEVDLFPLRLQLSHDIAQKLINYLYPPQDASAAESATSTPTPTPSSAAESSTTSAAAHPARSLFASRMRRAVDGQPHGRSGSTEPPSRAASAEPIPHQLPRVASGILATLPGRSGTPLVLSESNTGASISQGGDNRDQVDQMKRRASSNKTFLSVNIGGSTLCISYQGRRANNITDLRDFEFHAPRLELRNQVASYYELLMQVKREYMSAAVQHTGALVKEKLRQLHNRKAWSRAEFGPDWAARRLLVDMDRKIDEEIAASMRASAIYAPRSRLAPLEDSGGISGGLVEENLPGDFSDAQSMSSPASASVAASSVSKEDDTPPNPPSPLVKGKAPPSRYMILDPRKLMGKRLPSALISRSTHGSTVSVNMERSEPPSSPRSRSMHVDSFGSNSNSRARSCEPAVEQIGARRRHSAVETTKSPTTSPSLRPLVLPNRPRRFTMSPALTPTNEVVEPTEELLLGSQHDAHK